MRRGTERCLTDTGLVPASEGWFVMNVRDASSREAPYPSGSLPES